MGVTGISYQMTVIRGENVKTFEDLEVFQRAYELSLFVHRASLQFPQIEQRGLADQIRRASKSICANLAEGFGKQRRSSAEFRRYVLMAIGSADEMPVWLKYCRDLNYLDTKTSESWRDEFRPIARMLQGLYTAASSSSDH